MNAIGSRVVVRLSDSGVPREVTVDGFKLDQIVDCKLVCQPGELPFVELKILVAHFVTERGP
jgi:hypothetical protein